MKHITMASRRFAQAKAELADIADYASNMREDEGAQPLLYDLEILKRYVENGLLTRINQALLSAEWAAREEAERNDTIRD